MSEVGNLIRRGRLKVCLTQKELGRLVGCTWYHISKIERGDKNPSLPLLEKIFNVLKISFTEDIRCFLFKEDAYKVEFIYFLLNHIAFLQFHDVLVLFQYIKTCIEEC